MECRQNRNIRKKKQLRKFYLKAGIKRLFSDLTLLNFQGGSCKHAPGVGLLPGQE